MKSEKKYSKSQNMDKFPSESTFISQICKSDQVSVGTQLTQLAM